MADKQDLTRTPQWYYQAYEYLSRRWPKRYRLATETFLDGMAKIFRLVDHDGWPLGPELCFWEPTGKWGFR